MSGSGQPNRGYVPHDDRKQPPMHGGSAPPSGQDEDTEGLTAEVEAGRAEEAPPGGAPRSDAAD